MYTKGSPVVITVGALLLDTRNNSVVVQLKIKNVSTRIIKAVMISIIPLDTARNILGESIEHQYLDLSVSRDEDFGAKIPIILPD